MEAAATITGYLKHTVYDNAGHALSVGAVVLWKELTDGFVEARRAELLRQNRWAATICLIFEPA